MLSDRQKNILRLIVENYIKTAQPVSSENLAGKLELSSATIRNEMAELINQGYLDQPHTSAGRVPSEAGWNYYVTNFINNSAKLSAKCKQELDNLPKPADVREFSKILAKKIVELADAAIMIAYSPRDIYYTGLTNLFSQPEFQEMGLVAHLSKVIDHLDEVMLDIFDEIESREIRVGSHNPFSPECSLLISGFLYNKTKGVLGILGPLRMDYAHNQALLNYAVNVLV